MKNGAVSLKNSLAVSYEIKHGLTIALVGISPRETKIYCHMQTWMWTFIGALFAIANNLKPPKCPSAGKRLNKLVCLYHGILLTQCFSNTLLRHSTNWMSFKGFMLNENKTIVHRI